MTRSTVAALCIMALAATGARAEATVLKTLTASLNATAVAVAGSVTFAEFELPAGTDATGDGRAGGYDITGASIALATGGKDLLFTYTIAGQLPGVGTAPTVTYHWPLAVNGTDNDLFLSAGSVGLNNSALEVRNPDFQLLRNSPDGFLPVAPLSGTMADGKVQWVVPLSAISATVSSLIGLGEAVRAGTTNGVEGVVYLNNNFQGDAIALEDVQLPGSVTVGMAPAGTPVEEIALTTVASIKSSGNFTATLPRPSSGSYTVLARACSGEDCTTRTATVVVP